MTDQPHGLARGLTNYGDADFSLYLRRSFAKSMGYSRAMLARPRGMIGDGSPPDPANIVEWQLTCGTHPDFTQELSS